MEKTGIIYDLQDKHAILHTCNNQFVVIRRQPMMEIGQVVEFKESDVLKPRRHIVKYAQALSGIAAVALFVFILYRFTYFDKKIFAYVDVDINPSIELTINQNAKVIDERPMNEDAGKLLDGIDLEGMTINDALVKIVEESKHKGFLKPENDQIIFIAAALNKKDEEPKETIKQNEKLERFLTDTEDDLKSVSGQNIVPKALIVSPDDVKLANENKISLGKLAIYKKAKEKGMDLTIEDVKEGSLNEFKDLILKELEDSPKIDFPTMTPVPSQDAGVVQTVAPIKDLTPVPTSTKTPEVTLVPTTQDSLKPVPTAFEKPTDVPTKTPKPGIVIIDMPIPETWLPTPTTEVKPLPVGVIDDADTDIKYGGEWEKIKGTLYINATVGKSQSAGSYMEYAFHGALIEWYGVVGNTYGKAEIYIDGMLETTVDCYTESNLPSISKLYQKVWTGAEKHMIKIVVSKEKNPLSKGHTIEVDALRVR
ncbi:MAG: anti-sigma factor domain-containing protein [Clostridia bacterium]|nr:anti-sigma factor domain-containing protein [Clostridia bacterium]